MAASQCPKCGHLFEVRDGSGEPLPLAHCPGCDAYYPAHVHSCKWCGTTLIPEKARKGDGDYLRWIAAGIFGVAVLLGLLARDPSPKVTSRPQASNRSKPKVAMPVDTSARITSVARTDPRGPSDTAGDSNVALTDVSAPVHPTSSAGESAVLPLSGSAPAPVADAPVTPSRNVTTTASRRAQRPASTWVNMVAKHWVIVRADAERSARIVASVGPSSHVQLGETRGSWRRIRSRGIAGWVDVSGGSFVAIRSSSHRTRRVADR